MGLAPKFYNEVLGITQKQMRVRGQPVKLDNLENLKNDAASE